MKKSFFVFTILLFLCLSLCGCGLFESKIPEMTEEQKDLVVEYASETLLHYDKKHGDKLGAVPEEYKVKTLEVVGEEEIVPSPSPSPEGQNLTLPEVSEPAEDVVVVDNTENGGTYYELEDALGLSSELDFELMGYSTEDTYPNSLESYFVLSASPGNKLLVISFKITNITGNTILVDLSNAIDRLKMNVNGNSKNVLTTMLTNDLRYYQENLEPGESDEVVMVGEFSEGDVSTIDSLSVQLVEADGTKNILMIK